MALVMFAGSLKYTASMPPCATGFARKRNATTPTTMRTTTSAMATGAAGGNIRFALSNSSVMGTCPASNFGAAGLRGGLLSAMDCSIGRAGFRPALTVSVGRVQAVTPQHLLYLFPLPQGQRELGPGV